MGTSAERDQLENEKGSRAGALKNRKVRVMHLPAAIVGLVVVAERNNLVGLDVVVVGVDVDVEQVQLMHSSNLLLNGIELCVQSSVDGACC